MQRFMKESHVQGRIQQALRAHGWTVVKVMKCNVDGWPDLQAHRDGITVFIEVKRPKKNPEPHQVEVADVLRNQGFEVVTARGLNDVSHLLG